MGDDLWSLSSAEASPYNATKQRYEARGQQLTYMNDIIGNLVKKSQPYLPFPSVLSLDSLS